MKKKLLIQLQILISFIMCYRIKNSLFREKNLFRGLTFMFFFVISNTSAQVTTTSGLPPTDYVETIIGQGIDFSNVILQGNPNSIATYTGGASGGMQPTMESGIVLSTGSVSNPTTLHGPASKFLSSSTGYPGFPELNALAGVGTNDGINLQFDFIPLTPDLKINFQFGSEEYNEFVNTQFNDVFGFFIYGPGFPATGQNLAIAPSLPPARVSINSINNGQGCPPSGVAASNPMFYINNCNGVYNNAMDGFTVMLTAQATVIPCETYTIKLMLADGTDTAYDSWVFLQESGFYAAGTIVEADISYVGGEASVFEGCSGSQVFFCIEEPLSIDHTFEIEWTGTAVWGVDYLPLPTTITIPAGQTCATLDIIALTDGVTEGIETIIGTFQASVCEEGEIIIEINDTPAMTMDLGDDVEECYNPANSFTLTPIIEENVGDVTYVWNDGISDFSTDETVTVNPEETTTYTLTIIDMCGQTATDSITITVLGDDIIPEFPSILDVYCDELYHGTLTLPLTSDNGITGTWSPPTKDLDTPGTTTHIFTPDEGQCSAELTIDIILDNEIEPTFNPIFPICQGDFLPPNTLPTTSLEGITGSWSPALNNQVTTTYTFTPHPDQCAIPTTLTIEVTPKISPTFSNIRLEYCQGDTMQPLPLMSNNSPTPVLGTWFPPLNNQQTTTYTFVPAAGQCANQVQVTIAIKPYTTPQFIPVPPICAGDFLAPLPNTSINGITGSWSPALNNMETTTYTFTPTMHSGSIGGQCGEVVQMTIVVNQPAVPAFNLNTNICAGTDLTLPTISNNGIEGSWSPAFDNTQTTTYTFTPNPDECAEPFVVTINVNDPVTPTFNPVADICAGANLNPLPTTSLNGVSGTWSPALNNQATTTYTFTPNASECAVPTTLTIVVDQPIVPLFDQVASTCSGDFIAPLPTTSNNGITGTWSPALNYNQTTTYTFTPTAGICATEATMTITVTQPATPVFAQVAAICAGEPLADLPTTSEDGITGTWSPAIDNTQTTTYTFTPNTKQCTLGTTMTITVNPWVQPVFSIGGICVGADSPLPNISDNGVTGTWSPDFDNTQTGTYTFTPDPGQCGLEETVTVTVVGSVTTPTLTALEYCDPNSDGFGIFDLTQVIPIIEGVNTVDVDITFHETEDDALFNANNIEDLNPLTAYPNIDDYNQTIYVRISNDSGCFAVIPLELIVYDLPKITKTISPLEVCDDDYDGSAEFNLADALSDIMNGLDLSLHTVSYHPTQNDARLDENAIGNFANYDSASGSVWVRVEDDQTGCFDVVELTLVVNPLPVVSLPEVERYVLCDDDQDGYMIFDLETRIAGIVNGQAGLTVTFHDTYADAESNTSPYAYIHQNNEPTVETVFVRVQTEKGCFVITLMDLVVEPLPVLVPATEPITACDGDGDGLGALIDFTDTIEDMLNGANPNEYVITIHETEDDAALDTNAIADITAYMNINPFTQVVYVRVETVLGEGCFNIYPITIEVKIG